MTIQTMQPILKRFVFLFGVIFAFNAFASTFGSKEYTCPMCGKKFTSGTQYSYTIFGNNLDMRPFGAAIIPNPIHKCPHCSFVFPNEKFFNKEQISKINAALKTNDICKKEPDMPDYYYLARELEMADGSLENVIHYFMSAVWESREPDKKNKLINTTIEYIDKLKETSESYNYFQMVKLDLLRQLGQFDSAMKLIEKIKNNKDFYKDFIVKVIDLQIKLIGEKNQKEHPMPKAE